MLGKTTPFLRNAFVAALILALLAVPAFAGPSGPPVEVQVVGIMDGDTVSVLTDDRATVRVRLDGIDCPEKTQPYGGQARQFTADMVFERMVLMTVTGQDRYGRLLASISVDGQVLNKELVRAGYAWWYRTYSTDMELGVLEQEARSEKRGLWADSNPQPPWEYRQTASAGNLTWAMPVVCGPVR